MQYRSTHLGTCLVGTPFGRPSLCFYRRPTFSPSKEKGSWRGSGGGACCFRIRHRTEIWKEWGSIAARPFQVSLEEGRHGKSSLTLLPEWQEVSKERIFAASISTLGRCREEETDSTEVPWARWAEGETPRVKAAKAHEGRMG